MGLVVAVQGSREIAGLPRSGRDWGRAKRSWGRGKSVLKSQSGVNKCSFGQFTPFLVPKIASTIPKSTGNKIFCT